jgi:hypothetical protein
MEAVTYPAGSSSPMTTTEGQPVLPRVATDTEIIQRWADKVLAELMTDVEVYEDSKRVKTPLSLT